jgi:SAM-dependent methyltransferase
MGIFKDYATFYDTLYQEKDYVAECDFLEAIFLRFSGLPIHTILDLGCGTGGHSFILSQRNYSVSGVDLSQKMLTFAEKKARSLKSKNKPVFRQGDIRSLDMGLIFDSIVSMFAVLAYMSTNLDIANVFSAVRRHIKPGGLFIFDTWSGHAVLSDPPVDRQKIIELKEEKIIRDSHPKIDLLKHTVDIHYRIQRFRDERLIEEVKEVHCVRFLFPQEAIHYLEEANFTVKRICPFLRLDDKLTEKDWNMAVVAEAK